MAKDHSRSQGIKMNLVHGELFAIHQLESNDIVHSNGFLNVSI